MNAHAAAVTPVLRTVLLCDIVESTALVERLGDVRVVALLQKHDRLLREAMAFCHGQLIDKADGVLALFERPIQALDFALRYQRGLRELGASEKLELRARIGIHVGDVMMWANEPKDVLAGAKAFEVEGLAKPVAARLMNLALPGQILMSGMAQNLAQRAVGELGDAGANLRWLLHGRYSFKGVPAPMLVHEVGEPGLSPLRAPTSGAKAWREVPLWRRPPVLALELLLVGVLGTAVFWTTLRSPPAIAFAERDWVVVADLQNRTDEPVFDDALDVALRIGLEQSRHVNLVSELQIDRALERMQRQGQPVDRQLATELALREGAKAVILPTVAEVGGVVRVSLEVIDPNSGVTVYSESADGRGADGVLPAMDVAMANVRGRLGEAMASVENTSRPLEQVTTGDLEALRAFSLGLKALWASRYPDAWSLFEQAVKRDPEFAMAYLRMAFMRYSAGDGPETERLLAKAQEHRGNLSEREALFLDAAAEVLKGPDAAMSKLKVLAAMYPDEYRAYYNFAYFGVQDAQRYREAADYLAPAIVPQNPMQASAAYLLGNALLAAGDTDAALAAFQRADSLGVGGFKRNHAEAFAVQRRYSDADRVLRSQTPTGFDDIDIGQQLARVSFNVDRGRIPDALDAARELVGKSRTLASRAQWTHQGVELSLRAYAKDPGFAADLRAYQRVLSGPLASATLQDRRHLEFNLLAAGWMAAYSGDLALARQILAELPQAGKSAYPANVGMAAALQAELDLAEGRPAAALARLTPLVDDGRELYFVRAVRMRAFEASGDQESALRDAEWLLTQRGRAFVEYNADHVWQAANLIEANLALEAASRYADALGKPELAQRRRNEFGAAWPDSRQVRQILRLRAGRH
ncbi:putative peptide modification system cyclase [Arenimonas terrae]|nr:putative peptide modification system cyclase [Arenimonas terrae]